MNTITILFIFGVTNLLLLMLVHLTCRCVGAKQHWLEKAWYARLYNYHCYFWWLLWASVITHLVIAIYLFGFPWGG